MYLEDAKTVPDAVENLRKGIALGGLDTFNSASASKTLDDSKPSVPFMAVKDYRPQVTTEDTLRVVKESIHDSVYESSKSMIKQLDKIGDRLADVVEDFQKKQLSRSSRNRDRHRSNSRDRNDSRDRYRNMISGVFWVFIRLVCRMYQLYSTNLVCLANERVWYWYGWNPYL